MSRRVEELFAQKAQSVIERLRLVQLTLEHREWIAGKLREHPPRISELTFSNLFAWNNPERWLGEYKGHLLVGRWEGETLSFLQPIGPNPAGVITELSHDLGIVWVRVDDFLAKSMPAHFKVLPQREHFDYVYSRSNIVELGDSSLRKHRKRIIRFHGEHFPEVSLLTDSHLSLCRDVLEAWRRQKGKDHYLLQEVEAASKALEHFSAWSLFGVVVAINSNVVAYAIAEPLSSDTWVVHYTKTLPQFPELPRYLFHALVKSIPEYVTYVNSMQDLGISGIRLAKQEWRPCHMVEKCRVEV